MLNYRLLDRVFRALADPTRRAIIERLSDGDASVSDLAEPLPISLAAVMQHVQALEQTGLIHTEKAGRVRTCRPPMGCAAAQPVAAPSAAHLTLAHCTGIRSTLAAHTKSFSDSPRMAWVLKVTRQ